MHSFNTLETKEIDAILNMTTEGTRMALIMGKTDLPEARGPAGSGRA